MPRLARCDTVNSRENRIMTTPADSARNGPPPIESIIPEAADRTDTGYVLRVHMQGLRGIWHRLWAIIATAARLDDDEAREGIAIVRAQFEQQLGRAMSASEWEQLTTDAEQHAKRLP
ncbi:hypothetical protein DBR42_18850 [Pelomonas sp. HMWF004]|nr:hypothetical protein DBR42_18850 [Pelomonas sp. HMWF004]